MKTRDGEIVKRPCAGANFHLVQSVLSVLDWGELASEAHAATLFKYSPKGPGFQASAIQSENTNMANFRVYLSVKTCEVFLCFAATVRVRVYYVDFFVFRYW